MARMICKSTKDSSLAIKLITIHKIPMGISHKIKVFLLPNLYEKHNYNFSLKMNKITNSLILTYLEEQDTKNCLAQME